MTKLYQLALTCLICLIALAAQANDKHHQYTRIGYHGMVMITDGTSLYASHLPLYRAPHDFQLIYQIESQYQQQLIAQLQNGKTITLLPNKFDLNRLVNGEGFTIPTQLYLGHFERGGTKWQLDQTFTFKQQSYKRQLSNLAANQAKTINHQWQKLTTKAAGKNFYVYQIQTAPSLDAIVLTHQCNGDKTQLKQAPKVLNQQQIMRHFADCDKAKIVYFETRDFEQ